MAQRDQLPRPVVSGGAGLNTDQAPVQLLKETQDLAASKLASERLASVCGQSGGEAFTLQGLRTSPLGWEL